MQGTQVLSLGWEDPLEKSSSLQCCCLENPMDRGTWQATVHGAAKSRTRLSNYHFYFTFFLTGYRSSPISQFIPPSPPLLGSAVYICISISCSANKFIYINEYAF